MIAVETTDHINTGETMGKIAELLYETERTKAVSSIVCNCGAQYDLENFKIGLDNATEMMGWVDKHIQSSHSPEDVVVLTFCLGGDETKVE